ncbi:MAG: hypothetical protein R2755_28565 [Acidimicrobiales bacterium]
MEAGSDTLVATVVVGGPLDFLRSYGFEVANGWVWVHPHDAELVQVDAATATVVARYGSTTGGGSVVATDEALWVGTAASNVVPHPMALNDDRGGRRMPVETREGNTMKFSAMITGATVGAAAMLWAAIRRHPPTAAATATGRLDRAQARQRRCPRRPGSGSASSPTAPARDQREAGRCCASTRARARPPSSVPACRLPLSRSAAPWTWPSCTGGPTCW